MNADLASMIDAIRADNANRPTYTLARQEFDSLVAAVAAADESARSGRNEQVYVETAPVNPTTAMFRAAHAEVLAMHDRKNQDYGSDHDPFANIRSSEEWGIPAWIGGMVRANDKVHRLRRFAAKGALANEGVEDSLLDIATYSLISLVLYRQLSAEEVPA